MRLILAASFVGSFFIYQSDALAASFNLSKSVNQVAPGGTFTVSVGGDCIGRVDITVSNGTASETSVWVEENYKSITITAGNSGSVTVTATPVAGLSDPDANLYNPGTRNATVPIVAPTPQPTPTPNKQPATNTPNKPAPNTEKPAETPTTEETPTDSPDSATPEEEITTDNVIVTAPEDITSAPESPTSPACANTQLPWVLAGIFAALFVSTAAALAYVLTRQRQTPAPQATQKPQTQPVIALPEPTKLAKSPKAKAQDISKSKSSKSPKSAPAQKSAKPKSAKAKKSIKVEASHEQKS